MSASIMASYSDSETGKHLVSCCYPYVITCFDHEGHLMILIINTANSNIILINFLVSTKNNPEIGVFLSFLSWIIINDCSRVYLMLRISGWTETPLF